MKPYIFLATEQLKAFAMTIGVPESMIVVGTEMVRPTSPKGQIVGRQAEVIIDDLFEIHERKHKEMEKSRKKIVLCKYPDMSPLHQAVEMVEVSDYEHNLVNALPMKQTYVPPRNNAPKHYSSSKRGKFKRK